MTRTKSTYLAVLAVLLSPMAANADPIEITGTGSTDGTWEITVLDGTVDAAIDTLMEQVFWGDSDLARTFAATLADAMGGPCFGLGPCFAYGGTGQNIDLWAWLNGDVVGRTTTGGDFVYAWAIATRVPEPGTLALLGIGLLGMGLSRRRKKET